MKHSLPLIEKDAYSYAAADRKPRQALLSGALLLGPRLLPVIYGMLPPICAAFGIPEPELYLMRGDANARTVGHDRTAIIIYNRLLEDLALDEVEAVLAHECGHILAAHALYRQMAQALIRAARCWPRCLASPPLGPGRLSGRPARCARVPRLPGRQRAAPARLVPLMLRSLRARVTRPMPRWPGQ
jgi:hypothetical protein